MLQVGILLHQAKSGRLIVKLIQETRVGSVVVDDKGRRLGKVIELIGPVKSPYASVALMTSRLGKSGDPIFAER